MSPKDRANFRPSRKKRFLFHLAVILLALPVVEIASWLAIKYFLNESIAAYRDAQDQLAGTGVSTGTYNETIHPYLGWVINPQLDSGSDLGGQHIPINRFGFMDAEWDIPKRSKDRLVVGILGGSVAWQMTVLGESALREVLQQDPACHGKEIQIVRLALSGYKQPQQLMALNFVFTLGAEFDVIVNIDGYNEIALPVCENDGSVFAAYPRLWDAKTQDIVDPRVFALSFHVLKAKAMRQELAQDICRSRFRWSPTLNLIWKVRDKLWQNQFVELAYELRERKAGQGTGFAISGPRQLYGNETEMYDHLRDIWGNASRQIHHLCRGQGTIYLHVLQPNQYLPGSKPVGPEEQKVAFATTRKFLKYGQAAAIGYPLLISEGQRLRDRGIRFHDLTLLFANVDEPIYVDSCCHYNAHGNEMLARAIARFIIEALEDSE